MGNVQKWGLLGLLCIALILFSISIFHLPFSMADGLNALSLPLFLLLGTGIIRALKKRDEEVLWVVLSFIPWLAMIGSDIIASLTQHRAFYMAQYRQILGTLGQQIFLSVVLQMINLRDRQGIMVKVALEKERNQAERSRDLISLARLRASLLIKMYQLMKTPLDSLTAAARKLMEQAPPGDTRTQAGIILEEADNLKNLISSRYTREKQPAPTTAVDLFETPEEEPLPPLSRGASHSHIWIADNQPDTWNSTAHILRNSGFSLTIDQNSSHLVTALENQLVDVLLIDPEAQGEKIFTLCRRIRSTYNLLELPILMVTDLYADYVMTQGYAAGVNDFLKRPYDSSELTARLRSLVKLRQTVQANHILAQSESQKKTFLYFLTHNINTPLTVLVNRFQEMKNRVAASDDAGLIQIANDLGTAALEINDVVAKVLTTFRLADGRQTLEIEEVDAQWLLSEVLDRLESKAAGKNQEIKISHPEDLPLLQADARIVSEILYNLVDNAIKYSPAGTDITLSSCRDSRNPRLFRLSVSDQGPGVAPAEEKNLFGQFQTLSAHPTAGEGSIGLGLHVARQLARLNGGDVTYQPREGGGSTFTLTIPLADHSVPIRETQKI